MASFGPALLDLAGPPDASAAPAGLTNAMTRAAAARRAELLGLLPAAGAAAALAFGGDDFPYAAHRVILTEAAETLRAPTAQFDLAFAADAFERVPNTDLLLDEFHRVLTPDGKLVLAVSNADAYPYRVRAERYAPGPDAPAAGGYAELLGYLAPRFDVVTAFGYNRSFHADLDPTITDPEFAAAWAGLYASRPDLGSGVVLLARKRPGYTARGYLQDRIQPSSARVKYRGDWRESGPTRVGRPGATAEFDVQGDTVLVIVRGGPSAGRVELDIDGGPTDAAELYGRVAHCRRLTLAGLRPGVHRVRITCRPADDADSRGDAVGFASAVGYQRA